MREEPRSAYIRGGTQFTGLHERIAEWIQNHPGAHFDKTSNVSWLNSHVFYHKIVFTEEEDYIVFKLTFSEQEAA